MSQRDVYEILKELGGKATTKEIREFAKKKYPNCSLHTYVSTRLSALEKHGCIKKEKDIWLIIDEL